VGEGVLGILQQLVELEGESPVLSTETVEARENTWSVRRADEDPSSVASVDAALRSLAEAWADRLQKHRAHGDATFYVWYDAQAGELRVSLSSQRASALPFGATVRLLSDPRPILDEFLNDSSPGAIPWTDLMPAQPSDVDEMADLGTLAVWAKELNW
jgi:hypothetical protein